MADRQTKVVLSAEITRYEEAMKRAGSATDKFGQKAGSVFDTHRQQWDTAAKGITLAGAAMVGGVALVTKAAIDWESAWTGVTKTVEGTPQELAAVEQGLRDLSTMLPSTHTEIAAVAEAAGQLGIQTPNVVAFTRTMIDLGETTNLSAEEAATSLARFSNIMGTSQGDVDRLGSAIVGLGNNYATTEAEIVALSMRLAGAGKQAGLTEGDVLGLAAAMSSVGIDAEAGGTAMSLTMKRIGKEVETGGDKLALFAEVAGVSSQAFAAAWKDDAAGALSMFVDGLGETEALGKSTNAVLTELGVTGIRESDALLRLSSAQGLMNDAMARGNKEYAENTALLNEAEKRYATVESQLAMTGNAINDAAIDFGSVFLPAIADASAGIREFAGFLADLPEPLKATLSWTTALGGGAALLGGSFMLALPKVLEFGSALKTLNETMPRTSGMLGALGKAGLVTAGFAIIVELLKQIDTAMNGAAASGEELANAIGSTATASELFGKTTVQVWGGFGSTLKPMLEETESLSRVLSIATTEASGFFGWLGANYTMFDSGNRAFGEFRDGWRRLGKELAAAPGAIGPSLAKIRDEYDLTTHEMIRLIELSPELKSALSDQATAAGVASTGANLLKIALEGTPKPASEAEKALGGLSGKAQSAEYDIDGVTDAIRGFADAAFGSRDAARGFEQAIDDITDAVKENGRTLDINTQQGRDNERTLDALAKATHEYVSKTNERTGSEEEAMAVMARGRDEFLRAADAMGLGADEAARLADELGLIPDNVKVVFDANMSEAQRKIEEFMWNQANRRVTLQVDANVTGLRGLRAPSENGNLFEKGVAQSFENGGIPSGFYSGGPLYKFAEDNLPWEAFISPKPSERERNIGIWQETGRRLGVEQGTSPVSLEGMSITGTLDLGNGLTGFVEGMLQARGDRVASGIRNRKWADA